MRNYFFGAISDGLIGCVSESELRERELIPDENLESDFFDKPSME